MKFGSRRGWGGAVEEFRWPDRGWRWGCRRWIGRGGKVGGGRARGEEGFETVDRSEEAADGRSAGEAREKISDNGGQRRSWAETQASRKVERTGPHRRRLRRRPEGRKGRRRGEDAVENCVRLHRREIEGSAKTDGDRLGNRGWARADGVSEQGGRVSVWKRADSSRESARTHGTE